MVDLNSIQIIFQYNFFFKSSLILDMQLRIVIRKPSAKEGTWTSGLSPEAGRTGEVSSFFAPYCCFSPSGREDCNPACSIQQSRSGEAKLTWYPVPYLIFSKRIREIHLMVETGIYYAIF